VGRSFAAGPPSMVRRGSRRWACRKAAERGAPCAWRGTLDATGGETRQCTASAAWEGARYTGGWTSPASTTHLTHWHPPRVATRRRRCCSCGGWPQLQHALCVVRRRPEGRGEWPPSAPLRAGASPTLGLEPRCISLSSRPKQMAPLP
jgi:hypothetical protein